MVLSRYISCSDQFPWPRCDIYLHDLWFAVTFDYCFDWLGAAVSSLLVSMVIMEESRSLPMMYGISSHHFFYISFLWGILSLDVWNLVPSFFYISFFMGGTRPLPMMYGDPLHHLFCFSWATHCYHYMSMYCTFNTCQRCRIICVVQPNLVDPII